jgi:O-antigen ligase
MKCMGKSALYLWCAGFAVVTFDLLFTFELAGFTIKSYYFLFLAAAALFFLELFRKKELKNFYRELFSPPWIFALLLFIYEIGMAPFSIVPKKSFAYSIWLLFDILVVAIPGAMIIVQQKAHARITITWALVAAAFFLVGVLLIDLIAFQYGYTAGYLGYNQEPTLGWGMSRAHAFSYEPSYLSMFFTFSLLFLFSQVLAAAKTISKFALYAAIFLLSIGIFLLGSRTGWIMTAIGLALLLVRLRNFLWRRDIGYAVVIIGASLICFFLLLPSKHVSLMSKNLVSTLISHTDGSSNTRLAAMAEAVRDGIDTRGLGVGAGASFFYFLHKHPEEITPNLHISLRGENIMSTWGQLVAESGVPGILCYLAFALSIVVITYRAAKLNPGANGSFFSALLFFLLAAHLVGNVSRTDVWVWFALWMALSKPLSMERV